tara:strand:- start:7364 stop:8062 length:699 start_codon:yes stop_codon:yes gene_type:complete
LRILGLITARGGSKGIPGKNVKILGGQPLLSYVAKDGLSAKGIDRLILSTDDDSIAKVALAQGVEVPFMRPDYLAKDTTPSIEVVVHAIETLEAQGDYFDAVCLLQPTSPFKPIGFIDDCIEEFKKSQADCLISVQKVPHEFNPHWVFEENKHGQLNIATGESKLIPRRQELPTTFYRDGSVYVFIRDNPIVHKTLVHGNIAYKISDAKYYCNLDTLSDWERAERLAFILGQ